MGFFSSKGGLRLSRHFLFGSDTYLGFRAVKPHFLPWIRAVELQTFQTDSKQHGFTVRIANDTTGHLVVSLQSGSELIIQSRRWKYRLFEFIQAPDLVGGFGGSYLKPLVERFFDHLKDDCGCFGSTPGLAPTPASRFTADVWKRDL
jgi:hypothetical protein